MPQLTQVGEDKLIERIEALLSLIASFGKLIQERIGKFAIIGNGETAFVSDITDPIDFVEKQILYENKDGKYQYELKVLIEAPGERFTVYRRLAKFRSDTVL